MPVLIFCPVRLQKMPTDVLAFVLVLQAWLQWRCTQDRVATLRGGIALDAWLHGRSEESLRYVDSVGDARGLMVLQWGSAPSARVERQLRGRAGRQGDPGSSWAILSLEDESVQRSFPSSRARMERLRMNLDL